MVDVEAAKDEQLTIPEPLRPPPDVADGIEPFARAVIQSNQNEFLRAARSQRFAFATMKWLFLVVFLIALGAMIAAVRIATDIPEGGYNWAHAGVTAAVALMSIILFALLLYMRPMAALERNSVVQSFLTVVVNSYWTRLLYVKQAADIDVHLEDATAYTVEHLGALLDRQILGASKFMDQVRRSQDESDKDPGAYRSPL
jgi:ABC-type multidrug transport system fused ATPase/permease subunit